MRHLLILLCSVALLAGCRSTSESWESELVVQNERLGSPTTVVSPQGGWLQVQVTEPIRETRTPSERLVLMHTIRESLIPWGDIGKTALYVVLGTVGAVLYFGAWAALWAGLFALDARY